MGRKYFSGLTRNTFLLTFTSMFADISTEMLYPVLPIYLTQYLKTGGGTVGLVEGVAVATQNIVQGLSGWLSDKIRKRKSVAVAGYLLAALSKPLIGLSTTWQGVFGARFVDRMGTGIRSAPRDALIASSADATSRGRAFGLEGIGDNFGAFLGPILVVIFLYYFKVEIHQIFLLAIIPGLLAVLMVLLVKEKRAEVSAKARLDTNIHFFPRRYWRYLFVTAIFGVGNLSSSFMILQTRSVGVSLIVTILIYAVYNLVAAITSYPSGFLSDKIGRKNILLISFVIFLSVCLGFAISRNIIVIGLLFAFYGIYQGVFRSVGKAFATDFVPTSLHASGVGWYNTVVGLSGLVASITAGQLWDKVNHPFVFIYGAIFAAIGSISLLFFA